MTLPLEPTLEAYRNPLLRYVAATRPAFLSVTIVGCVLGLASAYASGIHLNPVLATLTLLFALVAHAGANVVNDFFDARSGCDARNTARLYPFTGGSRFIQNGVLSLAATGRFGIALLLTVIPPGLYLARRCGPDLLLIGLAGLTLAWAYSAPPLRLQARGIGEFAITAAWLAVVVGSDYVQRGALAGAPAIAGLGFALLVANLLYINQFPDADADAAAGKRTMVVRLGAGRARHGYLLIALLAYGAVLLATFAGRLPAAALISLLPAFASGRAARELYTHAGQPEALVPAIKLTILAAVAHGALLAIALAVSA